MAVAGSLDRGYGRPLNETNTNNKTYETSRSTIDVTMSQSPYLTVKEASAELGISEDGVRKLIARQKLRAIKRSERNTLIPRPAFDAYLRKINGSSLTRPGRAQPVGDLSERLTAFELETGLMPADWLREWLAKDAADAVDDSMSMGLAVSACGLVAEQREAHKLMQPS
jgi:excisionase family DNA binding protein